MENKELQNKYSLRKFKGIGLASAVIGLFFANQSVYANVTSDGKEETTLVGEFNKVSSSAKTTFTDDKDSTKKVTVDAVADIRYNRPTKANYNAGDADGTDSLNYHSKATVNYLLESNNSKLQDSKTVDGETATVKTPYDKKGIAYDTDGKDYRESTVEKTGNEINETTGKEEKIKANDKEYTLVRSEVVNKDKAIYEKTDKTKFNDIEAPVSPEGMHNNLGEINYGKITGKVYLVEETSDGHYGKFVEATNIKSDEEAVDAWKKGQATAKEFTKENVTLQEGDTILVMDRDTYAHGSGTRTVNTINYRRKKVPAKPKYDYTEDFKRTEGIPGSPTYAFWNQEITGEFPTIGDDDRFGTADDEKVNFNNETVLYYNNITKNFPPGITGSNKYNFKNESLQEILEEMHAQVTGILDYFERNVHNEADKKEVLARREELKQNIAKTIEMIKQNQIKVAVEDERGLMFSQGNQEILRKLRDQIEGAQSVLSDLEITLGTSKETLKEYNQLKDVELTTKEVLKYSKKYGFASGVIKSYHKDEEKEHYSDWEKVNPEVETREDSVYTNKGSVTISDDLSNINVVHTNSKTTETEFTKQDVTTKEETNYVVQEIITPIRAYKVMSEGNVVVNHYYKEVTKISEVPKEAPVLEVPEFEGGVVSSNPPIHEVPEYTGGVASEAPPVLEIPEFKGGVASIDPPIVEVPEYTGGVVSNEPPVLGVPEFKDGVPSEAPPVLEVPEFKGSVNGEVDEPLTLPELTIPNEANEEAEKENQVLIPQQKNKQSSKEESKNNLPVEESKQQSKDIEQNVSTSSNKDKKQQTSVSTKKVEELPQTGTGNEFEIFGAAASSILTGLGFVIPRKQRKK